MTTLHLLVIEGNTAEIRAKQKALGSKAYAETYEAVLHSLCTATLTVCQPADHTAELPDVAKLATYDGAVMTGSWLNIYDGGPEIDRQIELMRRVFESGTPFFGSCWGLQVATVAAGGTVRRNPKGREIGLSGPIQRTPQGQHHPLLENKPDPYTSITVHLDEVDTPAPGTTVLASNAWTTVQAAEIRHQSGIAWAVQYHPEFSFIDIASVTRRYMPSLIEQGLFKDEKEVLAYAAQLESYETGGNLLSPEMPVNLNHSALDPSLRLLELRNWIDHLVMPVRYQRGRN